MRLLLADDNIHNLHFLESLFHAQGYEVLTATDGEETLSAVKYKDVDLVLMDVIMSKLIGFETAKGVKRLKDVPIIFLTGFGDRRSVVGGIESGVDEFVSQPLVPEELLLRVRNLLKLREFQKSAKHRAEYRARRLRHTFQKLAEANHEMVHRLLMASEYRDDQTGRHIVRVGQYSRLIAGYLGFGTRFMETIEEAGPVHDIGKIGIPDSILLKPGKLTNGEFAIMKTHTLIGASILQKGTSRMIKMGCEIALSHHEKWNGSGYPFGRKGKEIPIAGRIVAVVDVFDALTSNRPYKTAYSWERSMGIIEQGKGEHFDPDVVDAFFRGSSESRKIYDSHGDKADNIGVRSGHNPSSRDIPIL